jgi:hypothetical protein
MARQAIPRGPVNVFVYVNAPAPDEVANVFVYVNAPAPDEVDEVDEVVKH